MTYEEAICIIECIKENGVISESFKLLEDGTVMEHSITKLSEEGVNVLDMAIEAMELVLRQNKPKNIEAIPYGEKTILFGKCQNCNLVVDNEWNPESCPVCEHKLDWSEE